MESPVFWDIRPCSPLKVNRHFGGTELCLPPASGFLFLAYSSTLKMEATVPPKRRLTFNGLHGVIFQKIEHFITTAVRTSGPALPYDGQYKEWYKRFHST
jgi:hypothetical protein